MHSRQRANAQQKHTCKYTDDFVTNIQWFKS